MVTAQKRTDNRIRQGGDHHMSKLLDRYRNRRDTVRRTRAIERALRATPSQSVRNELLEIANRIR
jgi:hypothetical protein